MRRIFSLFHYSENFYSEQHSLLSKLFLNFLLLILRAHYNQRKVIFCHKKDMFNFSKLTNVEIKPLQSWFISKKFSVFRTQKNFWSLKGRQLKGLKNWNFISNLLKVIRDKVDRRMIALRIIEITITNNFCLFFLFSQQFYHFFLENIISNYNFRINMIHFFNKLSKLIINFVCYLLDFQCFLKYE